MPREADSMLSAAWINARIENVLTQVEVIYNRLLYDGLLSSGHLPLETPITPKLLRRLSPVQVVQMLVSTPPAQRQRILDMLDINE